MLKMIPVPVKHVKISATPANLDYKVFYHFIDFTKTFHPCHLNQFHGGKKTNNDLRNLKLPSEHH